MTVSILTCLLLTFLQTACGTSRLSGRAHDPMAHLAVITDRLARRIHGLEHNVAKLEQNLASWQTRLDNGASQLQHNTQMVHNLTKLLGQDAAVLTSLNTLLNNSFNNLTPRVSNAEQPVAFSVSFKEDNMSAALPDNSHVLFDRLQYNVGGGNYSNSTGKYTVPSDGTYAFFFTMQRRDPAMNRCLEVVLYKNDRQWTGCLASACPPGYSAASNMCLMHMRRGDTIHAQTWAYHLIFGYIHSTFSGFKLN